MSHARRHLASVACRVRALRRRETGWGEAQVRRARVTSLTEVTLLVRQARTVDILSLSPADYRALASALDRRADEIGAVMPPVVKLATSTAFEGKFAARAKSNLRQGQRQADTAADAVRHAAQVARQQATSLETAQAAEVVRRTAEVARRAAETARRLLGGD